jgi:hypothetical protein
MASDLCALLDEMIKRLEQHAAAHPEREGTVLEAEIIVCDVIRDAAIEDGATARRIAETVLGRGIRSAS